MPMFIQVIKPTPGESPIGEAWVGLILRAIQDPAPNTIMYGLLSKKPVGPTDGYVVRWEDAMKALEALY